MAGVLIIDDDPLLNQTLSRVIAQAGHEVSSALTLSEGVRLAHSGSFDVVFLDVRLPDGNGLDALPVIRQSGSTPEVIIMTGFSESDGAKLAIENGAWDYIRKPVSTEGFTLPLKRALEFREEKRKVRRVPVHLKREGIVGDSPKMKEVLDRLAQAAASSANILIVGETGTGKELLARAIHENSARARGRFVVVDCAALPSTLVESILFGYERGAYTGAEKTGTGLIEQADGGTLFLDEVGEMPLEVQKSFLRVIQERRFRPVGGRQERFSDFRLVSATNRDLGAMVKKNTFREDLLFRLGAFTIEAPPLQERLEDIRLLTIHFLNEFCEMYNIQMKGIAPDFFETLRLLDWPGNVRELKSVLEETVALCVDEPTLYPVHLPARIRFRAIEADMASADLLRRSWQSTIWLLHITQEDFPTLKDFRDKLDRHYLERLDQVTKGNRKEACRLSGLSKSRLFQLLGRYNLLKSGSG